MKNVHVQMNCYIASTNFAWFLLLLTLASGPGVDGSLYTISDDRIRNIDITPTLGRGYSIMTNQFHSTCLMVEGLTVPSYNYDYAYSEYTSSTDAERSISSETGGSAATIQPVGLSIAVVQGEFSANASATSKVKTNSHMIIASMKIQRYYSSVREEVSPLSPDAKTLLEGQDYVGFFKACGPNYTRGIRRQQEVHGMFTFKSSSTETALEFTSSMKASVDTYGMVNSKTKMASSSSASAKFKAQNQSLKIKILGYGCGLTQAGSDTFVATTLEEFTGVMKFAFTAMTTMDGADHVGMVFGIEVVPWVHNTSFQVAAKLGEEELLIPMPRSLIPRAFAADGTTTRWNRITRPADGIFRCKDRGMAIDKYGYCCEVGQLFNPVDGLYTGPTALSSSHTHICKPIQALDPNVIKDNLSNNGEFVARLEASMRYKLVQLSQLEKCISAVTAIPDIYENNILSPQAAVKFENVMKVNVTVTALKLAIDPKGDYGLMKHLGKELDEWIQMYLSPCYAALFGSNIATSPGVDVSYFMAYPWYMHDECQKLTCLINNQRWDRKTGLGCVPSIVTGAIPGTYATGEDTHCTTDNENFSADVCKYSQLDLNTYRTSITSCWGALPVTNADYYLRQYCLPQMTGQTIDDDPAAVTVLNTARTTCTT